MAHAAAALVLLAIGPLALLLAAPQAWALPSYARQTGQQCAACHNGFPELTPYGRLFKLNGYTFGGGQSNVPPIAAMVIPTFTHTDSGEPGNNAHYGANDNADIATTSLFYGGAIAPHLGAFAQVTYDDGPRQLHWDNTDIRYARTTTLFDREIVFGASFNNSPTVTDVWNTTPAWGYPYETSQLALTPAAGPLIGSLAQQVAGLTGYAYVNRFYYAEFGAYRTFAPRLETDLGASPFGPAIKGLAPYWRLAVEPQWGRNTWELGTFGLAASLNPGRVTGFARSHRRYRLRHPVSVPRRPPQRLGHGQLDHREQYVELDRGAGRRRRRPRTITCGPCASRAAISTTRLWRHRRDSSASTAPATPISTPPLSSRDRRPAARTRKAGLPSSTTFRSIMAVRPSGRG